MTRAEALMHATTRLTEAEVESPGVDAKRLLLEAEGLDAAALMASSEAPMTAPEAFDSFINRRCQREPVSKILGYRDFWKHRFIVSNDVLDPRPDTETLIEAALQIAPRDKPIRIVDLGTGSGCILLTLLDELPKATGVGLDISEPALAVAKRNAEALNIGPRADFIVSDWFSALDETFDLVVSNPPYITTMEKGGLAPEVSIWDPEAALFAGMDGLQAYRKIADGLATVLKPNGTALFEIGLGQGLPVTDLIESAGFQRVSSHCDLAGIERCLVMRR